MQGQASSCVFGDGSQKFEFVGVIGVEVQIIRRRGTIVENE